MQHGNPGSKLILKILKYKLIYETKTKSNMKLNFKLVLLLSLILNSVIVPNFIKSYR